MTDAPWWRFGVIYQIYPRSFADSDGDGVGDLRGATQRLEYVRDLGAAAVWLSPIYRSPMADFGYDIADHTEVDPLFGTLDDADALIARAHELGLRVLLDFVPNHTSDLHPWFEESRSSTDNPKRSWYVWRPGDSPPNGWIAAFGDQVPAWTRDDVTGEWYLHSFLPQQPDLNWDEPEVEAAMHDVLRFWLRRGVDGFRIDVAHAIGKDPELGDNEPGRSHEEDWPSVHPRLAGVRRVVPAQPRPLAHRDALRLGPRAGRGDARLDPARHAVPLSGRGARDDRRPRAAGAHRRRRRPRPRTRADPVGPALDGRPGRGLLHR